MQATMYIGGTDQTIAMVDEITERAKTLEPPLRDFGEMLRRKISQRLSGQVLQRRTSRLEGSLTYQVENDSITISAGGGSGAGAVDYANIHHYGGTITPKEKKWLTIPFPGGPADVATGKVMMRASDFPNTFISKGMIFQRVSKDEIRPLFILKKKVDMPARPYMYAEESDVDYLKDSIMTYVRGEW